MEGAGSRARMEEAAGPMTAAAVAGVEGSGAAMGEAAGTVAAAAVAGNHEQVTAVSAGGIPCWRKRAVWTVRGAADELGGNYAARSTACNIASDLFSCAARRWSPMFLNPSRMPRKQATGPSLAETHVGWMAGRYNAGAEP